jgi:acyl carrier protein
MGIDYLDIKFRIEKVFGITVTNEEFVGLIQDHDVTVGELYDFVLRKTRLHDVARHDLRLSYRLWEEMQRVVHAVTQVPRERIELQTPMEFLFPPESRRVQWDALREASPYRIRELDYPKFVRWTGFVLAAAVVLIEVSRLWRMAGVNWVWPVLGILGIWMVSETYLKLLTICAPLRNRLPSGMTTVKELCRSVLASNYEAICKDVAIPMDDRCLAVWEQLTQILVDVLGVDRGEITFRSRMIRDLGMS